MEKQIIILVIIIIFFCIHKRCIKQNIKICLCVIAKNENLYVREFVEHYKTIGYDKIFIYDNNDKNGEKFEDVINDYIQNNFVQIINFREKNETTRPIFDAYIDCYSKNNKTYNWLSFYDMDEFLELNKKYSKIQDFLRDQIFKDCKNIKINWFRYKNDQALYFENKPLQQRIKTFVFNDSSNKIIKSTLKGNLDLNYWKNASTPHSPSLKITSCSSSGKIIESNSPINDPPDFTNAKLKHYYYKSFEEFCIKIKRGKCDFPKLKSNKIADSFYKSLYEQNKNNPEKLKIIYKVFNESII